MRNDLQTLAGQVLHILMDEWIVITNNLNEHVQSQQRKRNNMLKNFSYQSILSCSLSNFSQDIEDQHCSQTQQQERLPASLHHANK